MGKNASVEDVRKNGFSTEFTSLHLLHLIRFGSLTNKKIEKVQTQKGTPPLVRGRADPHGEIRPSGFGQTYQPRLMLDSTKNLLEQKAPFA